MGMNWIRRFIVDGCDNLRGTGGKRIHLVVEQAVSDAAVGHFFGIWAYWVEGQGSYSRLEGALKDIANAANGDRGLVLLMVMKEGIAPERFLQCRPLWTCGGVVRCHFFARLT